MASLCLQACNSSVALFFADVLGLICYLSDSANCITEPSIELPGGLDQPTVRECCINRNGFAYNLFRGDEDCTECIGKISHYS